MTSGPDAQSDLCEACHKAPVDVCLDNSVTAVTERGERMLVKLRGKARVIVRLCGDCLINMGADARDVLEDSGLDVTDMVAKAHKGSDQ